MVKQTRPFRILSQQFEHQCSDATFPCEYFEALTLLPCPRTLTTFLVMSRFEIHRLASVFASTKGEHHRPPWWCLWTSNPRVPRRGTAVLDSRAPPRSAFFMGSCGYGAEGVPALHRKHPTVETLRSFPPRLRKAGTIIQTSSRFGLNCSPHSLTPRPWTTPPPRLDLHSPGCLGPRSAQPGRPGASTPVGVQIQMRIKHV